MFAAAAEGVVPALHLMQQEPAWPSILADRQPKDWPSVFAQQLATSPNPHLELELFTTLNSERLEAFNDNSAQAIQMFTSFMLVRIK